MRNFIYLLFSMTLFVSQASFAQDTEVESDLVLEETIKYGFIETILELINVITGDGKDTKEPEISGPIFSVDCKVMKAQYGDPATEDLKTIFERIDQDNERELQKCVVESAFKRKECQQLYAKIGAIQNCFR